MDMAPSRNLQENVAQLLLQLFNRCAFKLKTAWCLRHVLLHNPTDVLGDHDMVSELAIYNKLCDWVLVTACPLRHTFLRQL